MTQLQCSDVPDLLKSSGAVGGESSEARKVLDATQRHVQDILKGVGTVAKGGAVKKAEKVVADRRKNPAAPQELSALAVEAVADLVKMFAASAKDKDEQTSKAKGADSKSKKSDAEKDKKLDSLAASVEELKESLASEKAARKEAEAAAAASSESVAALTASVAALEGAAAASTSAASAATAKTAKLEEANKYLLRKGLELAGTGVAAAGIGFGLGSMFGGGGGLMDQAKSGDVSSEYSATGLALRRCAAGASALVEHESGSPKYEAADLAQVLSENLMGTMAYLRGEFVSCEAKELAKLADAVAAAVGKASADPGAVLAAFYKQLGVFQAHCQRHAFGKAAKETFPERSRWPVDESVVGALDAAGGKDLLRAARLMVGIWDCLTPRAMGDVMYDGGVVKNLEWVIKLAAAAAALNGDPKLGDPLVFVRVHGVLATDEAAELRDKFQAMADTAGEEAGLSKATLRKLVALVCRDAGEKAPKDADLDAAVDAVAAGAAVDEDDFLLLYAMVKKGEVRGLANTGESL